MDKHNYSPDIDIVGDKFRLNEKKLADSSLFYRTRKRKYC